MQDSYSNRARSEALTNFTFSKSDEVNRAFLKGYYFREIAGRTLSESHRTDIERSAKAVRKLLKRYDIQTTVTDEAGGISYIAFDGEKDVSGFSALQLKYPLNKRVLQPFLIGLFISCGTLTVPEKGYDLEFYLDDDRSADTARGRLREAGFEFSVSKSRNRNVVYTKNSSVIEDFLRYVGASNSFLELMGEKVVRDIRNRTNRAINAETANMAKTARASNRQIESIEYLIASEKLYDLGEELQLLAQLRIENPERSLAELGKMLDPPLTKSSVNRKMEKLCRLARTGEEDE